MRSRCCPTRSECVSAATVWAHVQEQLTATDGAGERGLGRASAGSPGRRVLICVGESGPSVSEDESAELDEGSSTPGWAVWGK
jgi:hypothetical protein